MGLSYDSSFRASVIVPAHNEEAVIGRCLAALEPECADVEVVVVANGCDDETAEVAREFTDRLPGLRVVEREQGGKIGALNAGDAEATAFPRIYLDADIELTPGALSALITDLDADEPLIGAPRVRFDLRGTSAGVRSFIRVFEQLPYIADDLVGAGIYGLSRAGRARFATFPDVTGDDLFVQRLFCPDETIQSAGEFVVRPPRRLRSLVAVRARVAQGNAELAAREPDAAEHAPPTTSTATSTDSTVRSLLTLVAHRPSRLLDAVLYAGVVAAGRRRGRRQSETWLRDDSSRITAPAPTSVGDGSAARLRVAYLVSQYPLPSHVFVEREIEGLRRLGVEVSTFSVRGTPPELLISRAMRSEAQRTTVVLSDKAAVLRDALGVAGSQPAAFLTAARRAARSGQATLRGRTWQGFYLAEATRVYAEMRRFGLRHLHVHFANNGADIARLVVALGRRADGVSSEWRWSLSMHGPTEFEAVERFDLAQKVRDADGVACISDFTRSQLMRLTGPEEWDKLALVRMSVDTERYHPGDGDREPGPLRLLSVGRLVPEKGAPVLLQAVDRLRHDGIEVEATLVGAGPLESSLRAQVERLGLGDRVHLVGAVGQDDLPELYRRADVFCLPSFQEGLPVVLMEAMASGLPVVTTWIAGIPELVEDGVNGRLVTPGRADLTAAAIGELARDEALRVSLGRAARERVERHFSTEVTAHQQRSFLVTVPHT